MFEDIEEIEILTREDLSLIYLIKTLNEMVDVGILKGKMFELSEKAHEALEGFIPTIKEIEEATKRFLDFSNIKVEKG